MKNYYSFLLAIFINMIGIAQNKVSQELCGSQLINAKFMGVIKKCIRKNRKKKAEKAYR